MKGDFNYYESIGPKLDSGRYWCSKCQKGSDAGLDGYCIDCKTKGRDVVLFVVEEICEVFVHPDLAKVIKQETIPSDSLEISKDVPKVSKTKKKKA
jgi:hypothetical protein